MRSRRGVVGVAVAAVGVFGAGIVSGSDAQSPFNEYGNQRNPEPDETGPTISSKGVPTALRLSRSGTFVYTLPAFRENVYGSVSFRTAGTVTVSRKRRLTLGARTFRAKKGTRVRVRIKLNRSERKVLRRYRSLRIRARVRATDAELNDTFRNFGFTLKRPR
ncbi:MAG TPA: hypothetical protein VFY44_00450 [Thermoleophilaceae bacterium]|nr:hypothetical protein [Thermoleophilaceae bacterium]